MLHGDIRINGFVLGEWRAVRQEVPPQVENTYHVTAVWRDMEGYTQIAEFYHSHHFGEGALLLASDIIRKIGANSKRYEPTFDYEHWKDQGWEVLGQDPLRGLHR